MRLRSLFVLCKFLPNFATFLLTMSMAVAARAGRTLYEALCWSLITAALIVLLGFMGLAAAGDLSKRGTSSCRKAFGLERGGGVRKQINKEFSLSPLRRKCTYDKGDSRMRSFVKL